MAADQACSCSLGRLRQVEALARQTDDELRQMIRRRPIGDRRRQELRLINLLSSKMSAHVAKGIKFAAKMPPLLGQATSLIRGLRAPRRRPNTEFVETSIDKVSRRGSMGERASDLATCLSSCNGLYFGAPPPSPLFCGDAFSSDALGDAVADSFVDVAPILERA